MKATNKLPKQTRNPEKTRAKLLQAGRDLFALRGFSGVAVDEIVAAAGCNKRMLYHYFGNKEGIYLAVLREVFATLEAVEADYTAANDDPRVALRKLIASYFKFLRNNSDFTRLLMWENLNQGKCFAEHPDLLSKSPILEYLDKIIQQAKLEAGNGFEGDARRLLIAIIGLCYVPFSNCHTLRHSIGIDLTQTSELKRHLTFVQDSIETLLFNSVDSNNDNNPSGYRQEGIKDSVMDEPDNFWELG